MSEFEDKINSILGNPAEMEKLTRLASRFLGGSREQEQSGTSVMEDSGEALGGIDTEMLKRLSRLMSAPGGSDKTALLHAIAPYISEDRRSKLEKAVRFARMAKVASALFGEMGEKSDV